MGDFFGSTETEAHQAPFESGPWGPQQQYIEKLFKEGDRLYDAQKNNGVWGGQRVAGFTPDTQTGFGMTRGAANASNAASTAINQSALGGLGGANAAYNTFSGVNNSLNGDPTQGIINNASQYANNPQVDGIINASTRDMVRDFRENTVPTLNSVASATGNINSSRAGAAEAIAARGLNDRIADTSANIRGQFYDKGLTMSQNQYNQDLTNKMNAGSALQSAYQTSLGGLGAGQQMGFNAANAMNSIGGFQQAQNQAGLDADRAKYQEGIDNPWSSLGKYQAAITGNYGSKGFNTQLSQTQQQGPGNAILGALGTVGMGLAMSDRRVKENIKKVGETDDGLPVYTYRYKFGGPTVMGVMAQDVKKKNPDAVGEFSNGVLGVDYNKVA